MVSRLSDAALFAENKNSNEGEPETARDVRILANPATGEIE